MNIAQLGSTSVGFPITYGLGVMMKTSDPSLQRLKQENEDVKVILSCMVNVVSLGYRACFKTATERSSSSGDDRDLAV